MKHRRHKPHPVPNGNRHQMAARNTRLNREQSFTEAESINKYRAEHTAQGG